MNEQERKAYERYLVNLHREEDILETAKAEGVEIGIKKSVKKIKQAEDKAKQAEDKSILAMIQNTNLADEAIASILGLPIERVRLIRLKNK